jgi:monoterpene epsilon-lactone hydrolase
MENTGASMDTNAATDVLVQRPGLEEMVEMFLGEHGSPSDPLANPLHADLAGQETLLDDAVRLAKKATAAGVDVTLTVTPEMQHLCQLMAGHAPEATEAIADVAAWMRPKLGLGRRR